MNHLLRSSLVIFAMSGLLLAADQVEQSKEDPYKVARRAMNRIESSMPRDGKVEELPLLKGPVYSYKESIRGWHRGSTWAWGESGKARPTALMNMSGARSIFYEYMSLSNQRFTITTGYGGAFEPTEEGWQPQPIPTKIKPADSRRKRMIQIRQLSKKFTAHQDDYENERANKLRMLPAPIYRYEKQDEESLDGAIFAFIREGDLEVILTIEAQKTPLGPRWVFDCDRVAIFGQQVKFDGTEVWSTPRINLGNASANKNYYIFVRPPEPDEWSPQPKNEDAEKNEPTES